MGKGLGHLLEGIGDLVPGMKVLEKLRDAVNTNEGLSEADKKEFMELYGLNLEELDRHLTDVANGRGRERDFVMATGHIDWFMTIFGSVILLCFVCTVVVSALYTIPADMREIFIESRAAVRDIVLAIAAYYWGSSAGSRIKDMKKRLG